MSGPTCPRCGKLKYKSYGYCEFHLKEIRKIKNLQNNLKNRKIYKKVRLESVPDRYEKEDFWDINGTAIFC